MGEDEDEDNQHDGGRRATTASARIAPGTALFTSLGHRDVVLDDDECTLLLQPTNASAARHAAKNERRSSSAHADGQGFLHHRRCCRARNVIGKSLVVIVTIAMIILLVQQYLLISLATRMPKQHRNDTAAVLPLAAAFCKRRESVQRFTDRTAAR